MDNRNDNLNIESDRDDKKDIPQIQPDNESEYFSALPSNQRNSIYASEIQHDIFKNLNYYNLPYADSFELNMRSTITEEQERLEKLKNHIAPQLQLLEKKVKTLKDLNASDSYLEYAKEYIASSLFSTTENDSKKKYTILEKLYNALNEAADTNTFIDILEAYFNPQHKNYDQKNYETLNQSRLFNLYTHEASSIFIVKQIHEAAVEWVKTKRMNLYDPI